MGSAAEPCSALIPFLLVDLHFGGLSTALPPATRVSQRPPAPPAVAAEPPNRSLFLGTRHGESARKVELIACVCVRGELLSLLLQFVRVALDHV